MANPTTVTVDNQLNKDVVVYTITAHHPVDPNNLTPSDLITVYTKVGTVPANTKKDLTLQEVLNRLAICRAQDDFPVKVFIPPILASSSSVTVTTQDENACNNALAFYKSYQAQPYSPLAVQFTEIVLDETQVVSIENLTNDLFQKNNLGCKYTDFVLVSYWAKNSLYAWPKIYYCYAPIKPQPAIPVVLPNVEVAEITIQGGSAIYTPINANATKGAPIPLTFSNGVLSSASASSAKGIQLNAILRTISDGTSADQIDMFWVGKHDGNDLIAQPYKTPELAWWMVAYDLAYIAFLAVNIILTVQGAIDILKAVPKGLDILKNGATKLYQSIRGTQESVATDAEPGIDIIEDPELINVDVDVDIDVDVVVDVDSVVDTDVVVDVDIDIDIDIDDDVFAVIDVDVDVDVDVDIDVDVVTDTDNVVDTDVDTDIDTDVNIQPGVIKNLLNSAGKWFLDGGWKAILKNVAIMGGLYGAQKVLEVWHDKAASDLANMSPQQAKPLGLWLNYMQNEANPLQERWNTFADYVQQATPDTHEQTIIISGIVILKNDGEDTAQKNWRWSSGDENALVNQLAQFTGNNQYKAYQTLATYQYQGKMLPLKVACAAVSKYLAKIG